MYFWNLEKAKSDLTTGRVTDKVLLPYVIVLSVLFFGIYSLQSENNLWDHISNIFSLILAGPGTYYIYLCNRRNVEGSFLRNYMVIGWICAFRLFSVFLFLVLVAIVIDYFLNFSSEQTSPYEIAFIAFFEVITYIYIGHHVKKINS